MIVNTHVNGFTGDRLVWTHGGKEEKSKQ